jgi:hypothetical protein
MFSLKGHKETLSRSKRVIRPTEAFRTGSEKVRAGTYTDADPGCNAR